MAKTSAAVHSSSLLYERYELRELLGRGGMGAVYHAIDHQSGGRSCALKLLHKARDLPDCQTRFLSEIRHLSQLRHRNVVTVLAFHAEPGQPPVLVMELLRGQDLAAVLRHRGRLSVPEVLSILVQVGGALSAAHEMGIVHRDIKPHNIFLCAEPRESPDPLVKVLDFGLSKQLGSGDHLTTVGLILGTPDYLPPEETGTYDGGADVRRDVWSLGVVAYRALTGRLPFVGRDALETLFQIRHNIPPPLAEFAPEAPPTLIAAIERSMQKDKERRFASMVEFIAALAPRPSVAAAPDTTQELQLSYSDYPGIAGCTAPTAGSADSAGPARPRRWLFLALASGLVALIVTSYHLTRSHQARERAVAMSEAPQPAAAQPVATAPAIQVEALRTEEPAPPAAGKTLALAPPRRLRARPPQKTESQNPGAQLLGTAGLPAAGAGAAMAAGDVNEVALEEKPPALPVAPETRTQSTQVPLFVPRAPSRRIVGEDPHLPPIVKTSLGHGTFETLYKLCISDNGRVSSATCLLPLPLANEQVRASIITWQYEPVARPMCWLQALEYHIE